jgi:hypothetical protein
MLFPDSAVNMNFEPTGQFDPDAREKGADWPADAETMIGIKRLDNLEECIVSVMQEKVPGDLVETGVWRGGASIFMKAVLDAYQDRDRRVWLADSFQGLPDPDPEKYPADKDDKLSQYGAYLGVSMDQVKKNFERYELLDDRVQFLPGWFRDTLPTAPIKMIAVLRLDGDMYESTMDALENLYSRLSVGGYLIVDDYGVLDNCRAAVTDFRRKYQITEPIRSIDWAGIYWRREQHTLSIPEDAPTHSVRHSSELAWMETALATTKRKVAEQDTKLRETAAALAEVERISLERLEELRRHAKALIEVQQIADERLVEIRRYDGALSEAQRIGLERLEELRSHDKALTEAQRIADERLAEIRRYDSALSEAQRIGLERLEELRSHDKALTEAQHIADERLDEVRRYESALSEAQRIADERLHEVRRYQSALSEAQRIADARLDEVRRYSQALDEAHRIRTPNAPQLEHTSSDS